jgi:hypothetical protein
VEGAEAGADGRVQVDPETPAADQDLGRRRAPLLGAHPGRGSTGSRSAAADRVGPLGSSATDEARRRLAIRRREAEHLDAVSIGTRAAVVARDGGEIISSSAIASRPKRAPINLRWRGTCCPGTAIRSTHGRTSRRSHLSGPMRRELDREATAAGQHVARARRAIARRGARSREIGEDGRDRGLRSRAAAPALDRRRREGSYRAWRALRARERAVRRLTIAIA